MLSEQDKRHLFKLVESLTGGAKSEEFSQETLINNVERRMIDTKCLTLFEYLERVDSDPVEHARLISMLTIHTTSWFRENPHFVAFQEILLTALERQEVFKVWCAACSTGEEVYSFALVLEEFRRVHPTFDYKIYGSDIDPMSLQTAQRAVYSTKAVNFHVARYREHLLEGSGPTDGFFTLSKAIRERSHFNQQDLRATRPHPDGPFDVCICRNVLIYFSPETVGRVISNLLINVKSDGYLMLGHSESISGAEFGLVQRGHAVYMRPGREARHHSDKYRILSIDDSLVMRKYLEKTLTGLGFESITVASASEATSYLNFNDVDLITLDLSLKDQTGKRWLEAERREGLTVPVVILSEVHASGADEVVKLLSHGAQDYIEKDDLKNLQGRLKDMFLDLIHGHGSKKLVENTIGGALPSKRPDLIMIGASTGGPQALVQLLAQMPSDGPPIVITQHMTAKFTRPMAERLADSSKLELGEVADRALLRRGHLYMAYGDYHLGVAEEPRGLVLSLSTVAPFNGHRPSVDFMFNSALGIKANCMAILLTGMGRDGALGLRFLRQEGAYCVAQSERDCVVYGMPKEAIERGAADFVGTINEIRDVINHALSLSLRNSSRLA